MKTSKDYITRLDKAKSSIIAQALVKTSGAIYFL